ncbi:MAG: hypothetical protein Q4A00_04940, partial [Flavobacteriaceae bacterium]|nr:hypothetical protein [Flavobacteriaceae bacterium]
MFYSLSDIQQVKKYALKEKVGYFIGAVFLHVFLVFFVIMLMLIIDELIVNYFNYPSIAQSFRESHHRISNSFSVLMIIIIGPILEEILFRLVLLPKRINLLIFSFIFPFFLFHRGFYPKSYDLYFGLSLLISILGVVLMFNLLRKHPQIEHFLQERKKIIALISIVVFGL